MYRSGNQLRSKSVVWDITGHLNLKPVIVDVSMRGDVNPEVAAWIRRRLVSRGKPQKDLAAAAGVSRATVTRWLQSESNPTAANCEVIAAFFDEDKDELLWLAGHRTPTKAERGGFRQKALEDRLVRLLDEGAEILRLLREGDGEHRGEDPEQPGNQAGRGEDPQEPGELPESRR